MNVEGQLKLLVRMTVANSVLLVLCVLLLAAIALGGRAVEPSGGGADLGSVQAKYVAMEPLEKDGIRLSDPNRSPLENYLETSIASLRHAVEDDGGDPALELPDPEEVQAAILTGSLESPETQRVLEALRSGFTRYNMAFPDPAPLFSKSPDDESEPATP